ncbi:MAG: hypothetical protein FWG99_08545 [Treponema sp.]|nr:hypothetical protein [Treponema sp.]
MIKRLFYADEEANIEARRRIKLCVEKGRKTLDLSGLNFKIFPPEIKNLLHLKKLIISTHKLEEMPDFSNFKNLQSFSLRGNFSEIPDLGELKNLRFLSLIGNFTVIPLWITNLVKLRDFKIISNELKNIPSEIGTLKNLCNLTINSSGITELPEEIADCPLVSLDLSCGNLFTLPASFEQLKKLQKFIYNTKKIKKIPDFIFNYKNLTYLSILWVDPHCASEFIELPENIRNLENLKYFSITGNFGVRAIPDSISNCPLEILHLNGCFENIPKTFGNLSGLKELYINSNQLKSLPDSFGNLSSLKKLDILTEEKLNLPESFGNLASLRELNLYADNLENIPNSFAKLKNLKKLKLDSFSLKELPKLFGNLVELEEVDIFSGSLTNLPESLGSLKNLKALFLDVYNVKELPASLNNLSYVKYKYIGNGSLLYEFNQDKRYHIFKRSHNNISKFEELKYMGNKYLDKYLENCSLEELESLLLLAPRSFCASEKDKDIVCSIMSQRYCILRDSFKPTRKNILKVVEMSEKFIKAWKKGFARAKLMLDALYEKEINKKGFDDLYFVTIDLSTDNLYKNRKTGELEYKNDINSILTDYTNDALYMSVHYNPATQDDSSFWDNIHISRELNWNDQPPMPDAFKDHYISYSIHELYDHNHWALQDIVKINNIFFDVKIKYTENTKESQKIE